MPDRKPFGDDWLKRFRPPWWWPQPFTIRRPRPEILEIVKSRMRAGLSLLFLVVAGIFWYGVLLGHANSRSPGDPFDGFKQLVRDHWWMITLPFAPLLGLPAIIRELRVWIAGQVFLFNSITRTIERNGQLVARFQDVARVQVDSVRVGEAGVEYTLSLVLDDGALSVVQLSDIDDVHTAAAEIGGFLGVGVVQDELMALRSRI